MAETQLLSKDTPINELYLIGPKLESRFKKLGIKTLKDLFYLLPNRFEDRRALKEQLNLLKLPQKVTLVGPVEKKEIIRSRRGLLIQKFIIKYQNQPIEIVFYNQPFLTKTLQVGQKVAFWGLLNFNYQGRYRLEANGYEIIKDNQPAIHSLAIIPIYPETKGLTNKVIRRIINFYIEKVGRFLIPEYLPEFILNKENYPRLPQAFFHLHRPETISQAEKAKERFIFEELFKYQLHVQIKRQEWQTKKSLFKNQIPLEKIIKAIEKSSRLHLSPSQKYNLKLIFKDLEADKPMNRLLLGDVGSGKTLVAATTAYAVYLNGWRSVLMTPTEVLAEQTYNKFQEYLPNSIKIGLLSQSHRLQDDEWNILIGTQALLWKKKLKKVGLIIIDEQHRFGVRQRGQLSQTNQTPHILTMTATPIPRSLALTLFGHLDLSYLEPLPNKEKQTKTYLLKPDQAGKAYRWLIKQLAKNPEERAFVVTPLIENSDKETMKDIKAVTSLYQRLQKEFPDFPYFGLLHGKMKAKEKEKILKDFKAGKIKILLSTSVIEVGIDIPMAKVIIIEGAERFGLAQLHQLRGRVGRLGQESYCFLIPSKQLSQKGYKRLKIFSRIHSGHKLAEYDLKLRGPGQLFGAVQHGFPQELFPFLGNLPLLSKAQNYSQQLVKNLADYPGLQEFYLQGKMKDIILN